MKVLWATCHRPNPAGGGGEAHEFALIREASRRHDVVVVSSSFAPGEPVPHLARIGVEAIGVGVPARPVPTNRARLLVTMMRAGVPVTVWRHRPCAEALGPAVAAVERRFRPDLVQVWPSEIAALASDRTAPAALILTDCFSRQAERERALATTWKQRLLWSLELGNARRWEGTAFAAPAALACVSAVDGAVLHELTGRTFEVIPVALGGEWFQKPKVPRSASDVVFVAALDYRPNVDAVVWLAGEVWPHIKARSPGAELHIVGRNPVPAVRRAAEQCGAQLHADVPDVRPWYWRAAVAVSPVRLGSGMRNKVLHAMACGAPLVATSASTEGIGVRDGVEVIHADDADGFASGVQRLLSDPVAAGQIAERAEGLARRFGESEVARGLERLWAEASGR